MTYSGPIPDHFHHKATQSNNPNISRRSSTIALWFFVVEMVRNTCGICHSIGNNKFPPYSRFIYPRNIYSQPSCVATLITHGGHTSNWEIYNRYLPPTPFDLAGNDTLMKVKGDSLDHQAGSRDLVDGLQHLEKQLISTGTIFIMTHPGTHTASSQVFSRWLSQAFIALPQRDNQVVGQWAKAQ